MSRQIEEAVGAMKDQGSLTEAALKRSGRKREVDVGLAAIS